jgi:hypothetical protein
VRFRRLAGLLRDHHPHRAFIQEVSHFSSLLALPAVLASSAYLSTSLEPPKWTIAALGCCPAQVRELTFRNLQRPIPPALVREFNCVNSKIYTEDQTLVTSCKFSQKLCDIFKDLFFDAFRVLFPDKVQFFGIVGANPLPI